MSKAKDQDEQKLTIGNLTITSPSSTTSYINMMVYGDPGVGKTVLAASAAEVEEMGPVLVIDVEGGTLSLRKRYPNVDVVRIRNIGEFNELYAELRSGKTRYKTVILDSLTEIQKLGMLDIMKRAVMTDPDRDPDLPGIGEWGKNIEQARKLIRAFRDLEMNVIFTALAMGERNSRGELRKSKPSMSGKLADEVAGFLDIVLYMYLKEVGDGENVRCALSLGTQTITAKDRTDQLPAVIEHPTMSLIHTAINDV